MATSTKKTTSKKSNTKRKTPARRSTKKRLSAEQKRQLEKEEMLRNEIIIWGALAFCLILFVSNLGFGGRVGNMLSDFFFGIFGVLAYIIPFAVFFGVTFLISNKKSPVSVFKVITGALCLWAACVFAELLMCNTTAYDYQTAFSAGLHSHRGGGLLGGAIAHILYRNFGLIGAYVITVVALILSFALLTEQSVFGRLKTGGQQLYDDAQRRQEERQEHRALRRQHMEEVERDAEKQKRKRNLERKVSGVTLDTDLRMKATGTDDVVAVEVKTKSMPEPVSEAEKAAYDIPIHRMGETDVAKEENKEQKQGKETALQRKIRKATKLFDTDIFAQPEPINELEKAGIFLNPNADQEEEEMAEMPEPEYEQNWMKQDISYEKQSGDGMHALYVEPVNLQEDTGDVGRKQKIEVEELTPLQNATVSQESLEQPSVERPQPAASTRPKNARQSQESIEEEVAEIAESTQQISVAKKYVFPPITLLKAADRSAKGDSPEHLRKTALKLQQTLQNFGVNVTITDVSCGPSVTRYELQPEQGVKVSKIVNLTDDIKLNLAAADIRMEAPIPGKAAIGIEVPNKENVTVAFRELLESSEFQKSKSPISFAVGRDIAGKPVVADIAKMPHLLIAGATGSGKSVCINTIIMSILYKADPKEVKLIMIDPKVVELSVYNGIPHLFIPVVTDAKKAAGALHWAVSEMMERYEKFAAFNVRDLKGYNQKVESVQDIESEDKPEKLPQIVIIVDELADLMMVAPGDVEDAICRLAQLARAAGIHLIIATQRPSVNVITGLIKANMPSRVAFSVSSGVDSRTILDMNGAEKLLGKGDMLFYPQGSQKPRRVQGAFISDKEVADVVEFLKGENAPSGVNKEIEEKMNSALAGGSTGSSGQEHDAYFVDAGRFIIEKNKASIGILQRNFKIGFNRAARIMDQLAEAGVVGPEEGTKPRQILMSEAEFETFVEECV